MLPDLEDIAAAVPPSFTDDVVTRPPEGGVSGADWLHGLPRLVQDCAQQWDLQADGTLRHGQCAVVLPVRSSHGRAVLKVSWPHDEARHEHLALRAWDGHGAVRLLAADPARWAMLLEPLDADRPLSVVDVDTSSAVIGELLRRLDRPALPQVTTLSAQTPRWLGQLRTDGARVLPRRLLDRAVAVFDELGAEPGADARLVHTDLHDANVLASERDPWLAIDPKPLSAAPEFGLACLVWNRQAEAARATSLRSHLRRKLEIACDAGGFDVARAQAWTVARCALNAAWTAADSPRGPMSTDSQASLSWQVSVCKAMLD